MLSSMSSTPIYHIIVVRAYKKGANYCEDFMIEGSSLGFTRASQLCKRMATKGDSVNRAFIVMAHLDQEELGIMSEDNAIIAYDAKGERLDDPSEVISEKFN
jgi:hypothetical protein